MFLPKTLPSFFQMQEKLKTYRDLNFTDFQRSSLRDYIHITFIRPKFLGLFSDLPEFHIWHRHLTIQVKHNYISKSVCVFYFAKS